MNIIFKKSTATTKKHFEKPTRFPAAAAVIFRATLGVFGTVNFGLAGAACGLDFLVTTSFTYNLWEVLNITQSIFDITKFAADITK